MKKTSTDKPVIVSAPIMTVCLHSDLSEIVHGRKIMDELQYSETLKKDIAVPLTYCGKHIYSSKDYHLEGAGVNCIECLRIIDQEWIGGLKNLSRDERQIIEEQERRERVGLDPITGEKMAERELTVYEYQPLR